MPVAATDPMAAAALVGLQQLHLTGVFWLLLSVAVAVESVETVRGRGYPVDDMHIKENVKLCYEQNENRVWKPTVVE